MLEDAVGAEPGDDVELPPTTVVIKHRQTGGSTVALVLVTMGLLPFVQAVVGAFGSKLADAIDARTRRAVRRLLGRVHEQPDVPGQPDRIQVSVSLTDEDTGTRVMLADDLPAEAVAQLVRLAATRSTVAGGIILWHPHGDRDGHWYIESDGRFQSVWDHEARHWHSVAPSAG
jgi:hypothetical protein